MMTQSPLGYCQTISVADTGDGIPSEHLPHIFDRFYRTDSARSRDRGGAGLGLAIVRAIVEAHGGQIAVTSKGVPSQGSTFTIKLPVFSPVIELSSGEIFGNSQALGYHALKDLGLSPSRAKSS